MCINTISAIWHWQQKEQEQLQLSATKINKENKVHDVWVWVFVCVYFCWRKHLQATHFAITFPILPKISLKTKTVKTQRGWSGKNPRDYLIQLSHFTDKKPEAQGGDMFCLQLCCFLMVEPELGRHLLIFLPQEPLGETLMGFQWLE